MRMQRVYVQDQSETHEKPLMVWGRGGSGMFLGSYFSSNSLLGLGLSVFAFTTPNTTSIWVYLQIGTSHSFLLIPQVPKEVPCSNLLTYTSPTRVVCIELSSKQLVSAYSILSSVLALGTHRGKNTTTPLFRAIFKETEILAGP